MINQWSDKIKQKEGVIKKRQKCKNAEMNWVSSYQKSNAGEKMGVRGKAVCQNNKNGIYYEREPSKVLNV